MEKILETAGLAFSVITLKFRQHIPHIWKILPYFS